MPRLLASLLAAATCLLALTCAAPALAAAGAPAAPQPDELLFTQTAARGTLEPTKCRCDGRYILTLRGVDKHTVWFSDRPNRHAGHMPTGNFARAWNSFFAADPPNAALSALDSAGRRRSDVVELTHPTYDAKRRSMRYVVRNVPFTTGPLKVKRGADGFIPGRLRDVSLFIDDAESPVWNGCRLDSNTYCVGANLSRARFPGIYLTWAIFISNQDTRTSFSRADLTGAYMPHAAMAGADMTLVNLTDAYLTYTMMALVDLTQANLTRANLTRANLTRANLTRANLTDANLTAANLTGVRLTGADVTGADFSAVVFCHTWMPDGSLNNSGC